MWDMEPKKVLVGVDRSDSEAALQYAVAEAIRRGCGIHVVHVARPVPASGVLDDNALVEGELRETSQLLLATSTARAQELIDELAPEDERLSVSTEVTHGSVVAALQSLSRHAAVLVLEHHGMGQTGETPSLSVTAGVASVARCPVVAVPDTWRPTAHDTSPVVAGLEQPHRDEAVLEAARHEAERRRVPLDVVRADVGESIVAALLDSAADADLVVVARHHRKHMVGARLGPAARGLVRHSPVPVLLVDPVVGDRTAPSGRNGLAAAGQE